MVLRHGWMLGLGVALAAAPAFGQAPTGKPAPAPSAAAATQRTMHAQPAPPLAASRRPSQPGVPHTLAEALAATYANQPALQAERAKLRATDENVPQALAGWRPTVVMAGTAGYGDGISRIYSGRPALFSTRRPIGSSALRRRRSASPSIPAARRRPTSTARRTR